MSAIDFQKVFYSLPLPIFILRDGFFRAANPKFVQLLGYTTEELLQLPLAEIIHPDDRSRVLNNALRRPCGEDMFEAYRFRAISRGEEVVHVRCVFSTIELNGRAAILGQVFGVSRRERAEAALRKSEEKYRILFETMAQGVVYFDDEGRIYSANPAAEKILGIQFDKMRGRVSIFPTYRLLREDGSDFPERNHPSIIALKTGKEVNNVVMGVYSPDEGRLRWININAIPKFKPGGDRPCQVYTTFEDITERKRVEEELLSANQQLFDVIEFLPDATFVIDKGKRVIAWNRAIEELTGVRKEDILDKGDYAYAKALYGKSQPMLIDYVEGDIDTVKLHYENVVKKGNTLYGVKFAQSFNNGDGAFLRGLASPLFGNGGNVVGAIECIRDITDRKRAEEELRAAHQRLTDIIDFLPDATLVIDLDKKVIAWNHAIEEMSGLLKEDIIGKGDYAYAVPFYGEARPMLIDLVFKDDKDTKLKYEYTERRVTTVFGEVFIPTLYGGKGAFLWGKASPLFNSEGELVGAIESIRDITGHKRAEEDLQKAKEAAEAASRAKSEFLANMSHEIRTPMSPLVGILDLLRDTPLDERQRELIDICSDSTENLLSLINNILDFSKIEAGKIELENVDLNLSQLIESVAWINETRAKNKNLYLKTIIGEGIPPVLRGDPMRLQQVILNLVNNAIKFTKKGTVTLSARLDCIDKTSAKVYCAVSDTGIGIAKDRCKELFQPFTQADSSTTREYGGTGLGLSISKRLIEVMDGAIGVESEPGKGSTFWFTVPLACASDITVETPAGLGEQHVLLAVAEKNSYRMEPLQVIPATAPEQGVPILIVEDNPVNIKVALFQLEKLGFKAHVADNGRRALKALLNTSYAMILMDCQMPMMDGYEATRAIRKREDGSGRHTLIIAMTAHAMPGDREKCISAGMDDYISKPFTLPQLKSILEWWLPPEAALSQETPCSESGEEAPPSSVQEPAVDLKDFERLHGFQVEDEPDFFVKLAGIYLEETPFCIAALREAIIKKDNQEIYFAAHALKSSSLNIGAKKFSAMLRELEQIGRTGEGLEQKLIEVEAEFKRVVEALEAVQRQLG